MFYVDIYRDIYNRNLVLHYTSHLSNETKSKQRKVDYVNAYNVHVRKGVLSHGGSLLASVHTGVGTHVLADIPHTSH